MEPNGYGLCLRYLHKQIGQEENFGLYIACFSCGIKLILTVHVLVVFQSQLPATQAPEGV